MADDAEILKQLDFSEVRCQCEHGDCQGKCPRSAEVSVRFHALDHCNKHTTDPDLSTDGNYTFLLCLPCLHKLELVTEYQLKRLNHFGRPHCQSCGAPATATRPDVIREVTPL